MRKVFHFLASVACLTGLHDGFASERFVPQGGAFRDSISLAAVSADPSVPLPASTSRAPLTPVLPGEYSLGLAVNDDAQTRLSNLVSGVLTNLPPIASAGLGQSLPVIPEALVLDGSHSLDPEGQPLSYRWRQTAGPSVPLTGFQSPRPSVRPTGPGVYEFELTVSDGENTSPPDSVKFHIGRVPPGGNAGPTRYAGRQKIFLDGSGSFAPNNDAPLQYSWSVVSGPPLTLAPTNAAKPGVTGFSQASTNIEAVFELVVSAGGLTSAPARVTMIIVPKWSSAPLTLISGSFKTNRPTIFGFGGGDCNTGFGMSEFPSSWLKLANIFTEAYTRDPSSPIRDPRYYGYGDQLIVALSVFAPAYDQPIQTLGYSTGCMPACDVAERFNTGYRDPRYQVNRITLLDSGCARDYGANIGNLVSNRRPGRMFWVDNYYSAAGHFRPGTLNAEFPTPPADHGTPNSWYFGSWTPGTPYQAANFNDGLFAGVFFSVIGPGKNLQLETGQSEYYFGWNPPVTPGFSYPAGSLVQMSPSLHPARLPGVVELIGPTNGSLAAGGLISLACQPVVNAVKYQILIGPDARHVDRVAWEGSVMPSLALPRLPFFKTWWTVRATDGYGTSSWADPRYVLRDSDRDELTDESEILTYHTDPEKPDTDGDGHSDGQEVLAGTDPLHPTGELLLGFELVSGGLLRLHWHAEAGNHYDLEFSATMETPSWQSVQTFVPPVTGGLIEHGITAQSDPTGFYRVRSYTVPAARGTDDAKF